MVPNSLSIYVPIIYALIIHKNCNRTIHADGGLDGRCKGFVWVHVHCEIRSCSFMLNDFSKSRRLSGWFRPRQRSHSHLRSHRTFLGCAHLDMLLRCGQCRMLRWNQVQVVFVVRCVWLYFGSCCFHLVLFLSGSGNVFCEESVALACLFLLVSQFFFVLLKKEMSVGSRSATFFVYLSSLCDRGLSPSEPSMHVDQVSDFCSVWCIRPTSRWPSLWLSFAKDRLLYLMSSAVPGAFSITWRTTFFIFS